MEQGFQNPPSSARPRVWWHWINGNVTKNGIREDLEWMKRSGIAGLQNFNVYTAGAQIVDKPLVYMTPEWKDAFRYSAELAELMGLELGIAGSPGWSESGGPWVKPQDAMKKLAWSETRVEGGHRFKGVLSAPPSTTGPFQDLPLAPDLGIEPRKPDPDYYVDVAVLAYRAALPAAIPTPSITLVDGKALDASVLTDEHFATGISVPRGTSDAPTIINLTFDRARTIRSLSLFLPGAVDMYTGPSIAPKLEASSDGGAWQKVADIRLSLVPTTISFAPVTASQFRIVLRSATGNSVYDSGSAPGYAGFGGAATSIIKGSPSVRIQDLRLSPEPRVNQFETKAGFSIAPDYYALDAEVGGDVQGVAPTDVVDLTGRMRPDGTLDWVAPKGTWRILRLGYSLLGTTNHPAIAAATGLEVDKLDGSAVRNYLETYLHNYRDALGPDLLGAHGLKAMVNDSTEIGAFNWTSRMLEQFQRLRGYDARPWLPTLTGVIVGSRAESDKFLYDFRQTIADLYASEHYGTIASVAHENGLTWYSESLEGWRVSLGDDMQMRRYADLPMAALWMYPREVGPKPGYLADMRGAASISHLYGQNLVAAESMTTTRYPWAYAPSDLRRVIDLEFASGINRPVIHTSVHQPLDKPPGLSIRSIGQFFNRHETWAEMARPWVDYMARNSFMLQQGRFVADAAYFYGEEASSAGLIGNTNQYFTDVPTRYAYDFVDPTAVRELLKVDGGDLITAGGARYRILYLGGSTEHMTLTMLRRIAELAEAGATIVGDAPNSSPSLNDDAAEYGTLVSRLWSGQAVTPVGQGRVIAGRDVEGALRAIGVGPDFEFIKPRADSQVLFVHRRLVDGDIYYVNNRNNRPEQIEARFRVSGKVPAIWHADTGTSTPVSYRIEGNQTIVPLSFDAEDSFFVVFRSPATTSSVKVAQLLPHPVAKLEGPWEVSFQPDRGAPASAKLPALIALNEQADPGIRYFSGVATYTKTFSAPSRYWARQPLLLDLGRVGDLAEVKVNGKMMGTVWHAPFRIDIASAIKRGDNRLEVRVADLWVNRLIGDAQPGVQKITFTTTPTYRADAPLRPSGLIGPVQLMITEDR